MFSTLILITIGNMTLSNIDKLVNLLSSWKFNCISKSSYYFLRSTLRLSSCTQSIVTYLLHYCNTDVAYTLVSYFYVYLIHIRSYTFRVILCYLFIDLCLQFFFSQFKNHTLTSYFNPGSKITNLASYTLLVQHFLL